MTVRYPDGAMLGQKISKKRRAFTVNANSAAGIAARWPAPIFITAGHVNART